MEAGLDAQHLLVIYCSHYNLCISILGHFSWVQYKDYPPSKPLLRYKRVGISQLWNYNVLANISKTHGGFAPVELSLRLGLSILRVLICTLFKVGAQSAHIGVAPQQHFY